MKISIIIPILNEASTIDSLLDHLLSSAYKKENIQEILIADGGSTDGSQAVITAFKKSRNDRLIQLISSAKGRARQMNTAAALSRGAILYFLHADSFPPTAYDQHIIEQVQQQKLAGCFRMKFDDTHWWLRLAGWLTKFKYRACRGGDQSQFITRELFEELGRYNEAYTIYEDNDLINKLYARNEFVVIQKWLITSARKYHTNGVWKLQYHFWAIYVKKWLGASPEALYQYYKKHITG